MPDHRFAVDGEFNLQVLRCKPVIGARPVDWGVGQRQCAGLDGEFLTGVHFQVPAFELRHRQPPVEEDERGMILKLAVRGPLHSDQFGREHGKPRLAQRNHGFGVGHRIVDRLLKPGLNRRGCQCRSGRLCCLSCYRRGCLRRQGDTH